MAITNYTELRDAIDNQTGTSITTYIPDFISFGENRINKELRTRGMETALSAQISGGVISVPSDYIELKNVYIDGSPIRPLERKKAEWIYRNYPTRSSDSKPFFIARDGSNFIFGPYPDSTYTVKGTYYAKFEALSSSWANWMTSSSPELVFYAAMVEAMNWIRDDQGYQVWENRYQMAKRGIVRENEDELFSGSILRTRAG